MTARRPWPRERGAGGLMLAEFTARDGCRRSIRVPCPPPREYILPFQYGVLSHQCDDSDPVIHGRSYELEAVEKRGTLRWAVYKEMVNR